MRSQRKTHVCTEMLLPFPLWRPTKPDSKEAAAKVKSGKSFLLDLLLLEQDVRIDARVVLH